MTARVIAANMSTSKPLVAQQDSQANESGLDLSVEQVADRIHRLVSDYALSPAADAAQYFSVASETSRYAAVAQPDCTPEHFETLCTALELIESVTIAATYDLATRTLVEKLAASIGSASVAFGRCRAVPKKDAIPTVDVMWISGIAELDAKSREVSHLQECMRELVHGDRDVLEATLDREAIALNAFLVDVQAQAAISHRITHTDGTCIGALVVWSSTPQAVKQIQQLFALIEPSVGVALFRMIKAESISMIPKWLRADKARRLRAKIVCYAFLVLMAAIFWIPIPFSVKATANLEPKTKQYLAAKFDGKIRSCHVKPGDSVSKGQLLLELDSEETELQVSTMLHEIEQAVKKARAAQVAREFAEQRVHELETKRLRAKLAILQEQLDASQVYSPMDGLVVSGDWAESLGAPIGRGDVIFEVGALHEIRIEIAIPDADIALAAPGQKATLILDALPRERFTASIDTILPRAEIIDRKNVFVARASIENQNGLLRPGMAGEVNVLVGERTVAFVLLHRLGRQLAKLWW